jgi:hypothetical protein
MNTIHHVNPGCLFSKPGLGPAAELLFGIAQKVTKKASPGPRLFPPVLATGGTKTNRPMARCRAQWAHGFWSWTARCSAPRRGLTGRLVMQQLFASNDCPAVVSACFTRLLTLSLLCVKQPTDCRSRQKAVNRMNARIRSTDSLVGRPH